MLLGRGQLKEQEALYYTADETRYRGEDIQHSISKLEKSLDSLDIGNDNPPSSNFNEDEVPPHSHTSQITSHQLWNLSGERAMIKEKFYSPPLDLFSTADESDFSPTKELTSNLAEMDDNLFLEIIQNKLHFIEKQWGKFKKSSSAFS